MEIEEEKLEVEMAIELDQEEEKVVVDEKKEYLTFEVEEIKE